MKKLNKRKTAPFFRIFLFSCVTSLLFFLFLIGFYFFQVHYKKQLFLSPLPKATVASRTTVDANTLEKLLKEKNLSFSFLTPLDDHSFMVSLSSGEEIIFSGSKSLTTQVSSLQLILSRLTIEGKRFGRLDFRFDKPVVSLR